MNRILNILLVFLFSFTIFSCSEKEEHTTSTDTTAPTIAEVTAVTTPTTDNNTINLTSLSAGAYSNCTMSVTDAAGNVSSTLTLSSFSVIEQMGGSIQGAELSLSTAVTTVAGTVDNGSANGTGTSASFNYPSGITTDGTNLYVADSSNHMIRKIVISTGAVTTAKRRGLKLNLI